MPHCLRRHQTPGHVPGVFVFAFTLFLLPPAAPVFAECTPTAPLRPARIDHVIDGDTVALQGGGHVRLIGINAPETGHRDRPGEPFGGAARTALAKLLPPGTTVYLQPGVEAQDRYGRQLAHLFQREAGGSVEVELLRAGLAQQVAIPPNVEFAVCLQNAERTARSGGRGLWADPYFAPRDARTLSIADAGYRRVRVTIEAARRDRHGWWLETGGPLVLRLDDRDAPSFTSRPEAWAGKTLIVRGWVRDRSSSAAVKQHGFGPLLLPLQHAAMVESGL